MGQGDWLLSADGKILLINGKLALSNGSGDDCCCGAAACEACQTVDAAVSFSGVTPCWTGCDFLANHNGGTLGSYSLPNEDPPPAGILCKYAASVASGITITIYDFPNPCGGDVCDSWPYNTVDISLVRRASDGLWQLTASFVVWNVFVSDWFAHPGSDEWCWTKTVSNLTSIGDCAEFNDSNCSDGLLALPNYGGSCTITVG